MSLKVTFIGHATLLIQWNGLTILTDPVFSNHVLWFKRLTPLAFDPATLPKIDAILLSHAHYDHLDRFSYKYISSEIPIVVPEGMAGAIAPFVANPVIELATWGRHTLGGQLEICAIPAKHPGGRFCFRWRYPKCHGYVLTLNGESLYFSGDTAYQDVFGDLKNLFPIKTALLSSATIRSRFYSKNRHMSLDEMINAWGDLGCPDLIPYHWGSFFKWCNNPKETEAILKRKAMVDPILADKLHLLKNGESWTKSPTPL